MAEPPHLLGLCERDDAGQESGEAASEPALSASHPGQLRRVLCRHAPQGVGPQWSKHELEALAQPHVDGPDIVFVDGMGLRPYAGSVGGELEANDFRALVQVPYRRVAGGSRHLELANQALLHAIVIRHRPQHVRDEPPPAGRLGLSEAYCRERAVELAETQPLKRWSPWHAAQADPEPVAEFADQVRAGESRHLPHRLHRGDAEQHARQAPGKRAVRGWRVRQLRGVLLRHGLHCLIPQGIESVSQLRCEFRGLR
mmetsp:Transcript_39945/g.110979  ORF Transcript_39945/g.110979 Transcript_39945/m.110979 type:complete len:256 (+) Transcript_39945:456-1223(+)